jgi:betaine-homocysteine S-methyltransferase
MTLKKKSLLDRLEKDVVLCAEGYLFELERRGYLKAGPFVPEVVLDYPEAVKELHREFLRAGSDIIEAFTYYASKEKLATVGRENDLEAMNRQAVRLAGEVAKEGDALVAGDVCNTWMYDPDKKTASSKIVRQMYVEQITWAKEEGIDFVISETNDYLGEALIALEVIKSFGLPAVVTLASVQADKTRDGYDYVQACKILKENGADVVGLNCDHGPETMFPIIRKVRDQIDGYIAMLPVPYHTTKSQYNFEALKENNTRVFPLALERFLYNRFEAAEFAIKARNMGINYIGLCCGANPVQIRAMAEALGRTPLASRYSPDMDLHPMFSANIKQKDAQFAQDWQD